MAKTGWTPAHVAAKHTNEALVAILTDGGKDLDLLQREKAWCDDVKVCLKK